MPDQSEAPIVRKLLALDEPDAADRAWLGDLVMRNPDGPEAAEIIRLCEEALERIAAGDFNCMPRQRFIAAQCVAQTTLAQIKGQNP